MTNQPSTASQNEEKTDEGLQQTLDTQHKMI